MHTLLLSLFAVLALSLSLPSAASAQTRKERAQQHVKKGQAHQAAGEYDQALTEYRAAYDLLPHPLLLFNLAQVYRLQGKLSEAVDHYEQYLELEPEGKGAAQARAYIEELRPQLPAETAPAE